MANVLQKIFGTKQEREIRRMQPAVEEVNDILIALHDYRSQPFPITHLLGMEADEIKRQTAEFERRWAELIAGISEEDPERDQKLREAENKAAQWFTDGEEGEPCEFDWRAIYWGIESEVRDANPWAGAGDDWICEHLDERMGRPIYRELRAELEEREKGAAERWLEAKSQLQERIRPALVARTRAWQKRLSARAKEIAEEVKKADEDARKELW